MDAISFRFAPLSGISLEHLEQRRRRRRQVHTKELVPSESSPAFAVRSLPAPPAAPLLFCNQAILAKAKLSPGEQKQGTEKAPCPTDEQERYPTYPGPRSITHQPHAAHTYRVAKLIERGRSRLDKITSHVRRLSSRDHDTSICHWRERERALCSHERACCMHVKNGVECRRAREREEYMQAGEWASLSSSSLLIPH